MIGPSGSASRCSATDRFRHRLWCRPLGDAFWSNHTSDDPHGSEIPASAACRSASGVASPRSRRARPITPLQRSWALWVSVGISGRRLRKRMLQIPAFAGMTVRVSGTASVSLRDFRHRHQPCAASLPPCFKCVCQLAGFPSSPRSPYPRKTDNGVRKSRTILRRHCKTSGTTVCVASGVLRDFRRCHRPRIRENG